MPLSSSSGQLLTSETMSPSPLHSISRSRSVERLTQVFFGRLLVQIVWAFLDGTELGWIADFSVKLSSAQKTVSLVSSKFVRRWRYHKRNWICGVAQTPYPSWDHIKCNNTWGISPSIIGHLPASVKGRSLHDVVHLQKNYLGIWLWMKRRWFPIIRV
jgi:hypothetical protein